MSPQPVKFDMRGKELYLEKLQETGNFASACAHANISDETVRLHREADREFALAEERARRLFVDACEREAIRRGRDGVEKPVFYQGKRVDDSKIREYSDTLLLAVLKKHDPGYRDRATVDMNLSGGVLVIGSEKSLEEWIGRYSQPKVGDATPDDA